MKKTIKEVIVSEYLEGGITYRELGKKYKIPHRTICDWVLESQGRKKTWREKLKRQKQREKQLPYSEELELPNDVKSLQIALHKSELHNKLLEELLRLSEEHTGINLRKKFGTKRS